MLQQRCAASCTASRIEISFDEEEHVSERVNHFGAVGAVGLGPRSSQALSTISAVIASKWLVFGRERSDDGASERR